MSHESDKLRETIQKWQASHLNDCFHDAECCVNALLDELESALAPSAGERVVAGQVWMQAWNMAVARCAQVAKEQQDLGASDIGFEVEQVKYEDMVTFSEAALAIPSAAPPVKPSKLDGSMATAPIDFSAAERGKGLKQCPGEMAHVHSHYVMCCRYVEGHTGKHRTCHNPGVEWENGDEYSERAKVVRASWSKSPKPRLTDAIALKLPTLRWAKSD